jgi:hypothetical protein
LRCYAVLAPVSRSYPPLRGRLVTCYSPGRHFTHGLLHFLVRLACVRHAASVDSEPGSNSRLKPDACRRVVGRLPSPGSKAGMAATESLARCSGLSCEIVQTYARMISHDWHVQPSCQRPNRWSAGAGEFGTAGNSVFQLALSRTGWIAHHHTGRNPTVLETLQTYLAAQNPVNDCFPQNFQMISTVGRNLSGRAAGRKQIPRSARNDRGRDLLWALIAYCSALGYGLPLCAAIFAHALAED